MPVKKISTKLPKPKTAKKTMASKISKKKRSNVTLIITEKPQAAQKIAAALSKNKDEKYTTREKVSYYEFQRDGRTYIVGCAVGHLFGIQQNEVRGPFPNFNIGWKPAYEKKASAFTKRYYDALKQLSSEADEFIIATDFDREGEVIGWNIVRFLCNQNDAKRMKFSTLTSEELEESFQNLNPHIEWGAAYAGETRHYLDWYYGINLSRGLMKALTSAGQFRILSIGRIQGPSLDLLVEKEKEIAAFVSTPYWESFLQIQDIKKQKLEVKYEEEITNKAKLLQFEHLKGKNATAQTIIKETKSPAPIPFDLTTLQTESYRLFKLTPAQTLNIAQVLYTDGLISYPRTSSQEYPKVNYSLIMKKLNKYTTLTKYATNTLPTKGYKTDPAHPAIYPTGDYKKNLRELDKKVYDLIVKRFISCFCDPAILESKKVTVEVYGLKFIASGSIIKEKNWLNVYPSPLKEEKIPTINGDVDILEIRIEEKMTKPPKRYTQASLIKELEKRNLGTKATRASIIETLFDRGYATGKSIEVTDLGMQLHETLSKISPIILDEKMTSDMEEEMEHIELSKDDFQKQEDKMLIDAKKNVENISEKITKKLKEIGENLADANERVWEQEKESNTMSECPICKKGHFAIKYGKRFSRFFVACDNYPECKTTFSLPPKGAFKPSRDKDGNQEFCEECKYPLVVCFRKGKAPWKLCFNPKCPSNKEIQEKKEEFKKKLESGEIEIKDGKVIDHTKE